MPEGKCKKCGAKFYGWALKAHEHNTCDQCGGEVVIIPDPPASKEVARCSKCGATYDDRESVDQVKKWLSEPDPYAPCPNFACNGQMEVFEDGSKVIHAG